jgi:CRISPR-associated protein (TIGR03986 family)
MWIAGLWSSFKTMKNNYTMEKGILFKEGKYWKVKFEGMKMPMNVPAGFGLTDDMHEKEVMFDKQGGPVKCILYENKEYKKSDEAMSTKQHLKRSAYNNPQKRKTDIANSSTSSKEYVDATIIKREDQYLLKYINGFKKRIHNGFVNLNKIKNLNEPVEVKVKPARGKIESLLYNSEELVRSRGGTNTQNVNNNQPQDRQPARAPYNFVSINEDIVDAKKFSNKSIIPPFDRFAQDHHSGYIDLAIEAKTKVFIGSGSSETGNYKFFAPNGTPRIPGSSIRGMVRSLVEICSWGQFEFFEDKQLFYRTFENSSMGKDFYRKRMVDVKGQPKVRAGYLTKDGRNYKIIPAKCDSSLCNTEFYRIHYNKASKKINYIGKLFPFNVKTVYFKPVGVANQSSHHSGKALHYPRLDSVSDTQDASLYPIEGNLIASGDIYNKKHLHWVINLTDKSNPLQYKEVSQDVINTYKEDANRKAEKPDPNDPNPNPRKKKKISFDVVSRLKKQGQEVPCFYLEENGVITAIGHTPYFRLPYKNKIGDLLPPEHNKFKGIDIPTAIFGNESTDKEDSGFAGRVFFEDAKCENNCDNENATTYRGQPTDITPKPTSFQLYLKQDSTKVPKDQLKHYDTIIGFDFAFELLDKVIEDKKMQYDKNKGFSVAFELLDNVIKEQLGLNDTSEKFDSAFQSLDEELKRKLTNCKVSDGFGRAYQLLDDDLKHQLKHCEIKAFAGSLGLLDELLKDKLKQYDTPRVLLRGNKLYWHKTPDPGSNNNDTLQFKNTRIRFTNLTKIELGALLFVLDLPEGCCHKIGMGKPQGLGSIKITPKLYIENPREKYKSFAAAMNYELDVTNIDDYKRAFEGFIKDNIKGDTSQSLWEDNRLKELRKMLDFDNKPDNKPDNKQTNYMGNYSAFADRKVLPDATDVK